MLKIGIIGTGGMGEAFARQLVRAGYEIMLSNSRGPESLSGLVKSLNGNVRACSVKEAALAEVVILSVPWKHIPEVAASVSSWEGRIVIDPTNPIIMPGFQIAALHGKMSSEIVVGLLPGARLVKAFNTLNPELLGADPYEAGGRRVVFYSGNEVTSKTIVSGIIDKTGFAGIDLGKLNEGGRLQNFPDGPLPAHNLILLNGEI